MSKRDLVLNAIAETSGVARNQLNDQTNLVRDLALDSLAVVELVLQLEEQAGVTIPDEKLQSVETVGELIKLVDELAG